MQLETSLAQVRKLRKLLQSDQLSTFAALRLLDRLRGLAPAVSSLALALEDLWTQLWSRGTWALAAGSILVIYVDWRLRCRCRRSN